MKRIAVKEVPSAGSAPAVVWRWPLLSVAADRALTSRGCRRGEVACDDVVLPQ